MGRPPARTHWVRGLLLLACVCSTFAVNCKDNSNSCSACLDTKKFAGHVCSYCVHMDPETGEADEAPVCTSHPISRCPPGEGWAHVKYNDAQATAGTCSAFLGAKYSQSMGLSKALLASKDARSGSAGGLNKRMSYETGFKFGGTKLATEKTGTVVRVGLDFKLMHLDKATRAKWVGKLYLKTYLPKAKKLPARKKLSQSAFLGKCYAACKEFGSVIPAKQSTVDALNAAVGVKFLGPDGLIDLLSETGCPALANGGVKYLDVNERKAYEYKVDETQGGNAGLIVKSSDGGPNGKAGTKLDTCGMKTHERGDGWAIFAISPDGKIYSNTHAVGIFHHSSFLSGGKVKAAGEWLVRDGKVIAITDKTGHYKVGAAHLAAFVKQLTEADAEGIASAVAAHLIDPKPPVVYYQLPVARLMKIRRTESMTSLYKARAAWRKTYDEAVSDGDSPPHRVAMFSEALTKTSNNLADTWNREVTTMGDRIEKKDLNALGRRLSRCGGGDLERDVEPLALQPRRLD